MDTDMKINFYRPVFFVPYVLMAGLVLLFFCFLFQHQHDASVQSTKQLTPGELVDKAMAIPGAIVISPHRDLVEMGLAELTNNPQGCPVSLTADAPSVAVHTRKNWCVWEFGSRQLLDYHNKQHCDGVAFAGHGITFISSAIGYQKAYDLFRKCVDDGNGEEFKTIVNQNFSNGTLKLLDYSRLISTRLTNEHIIFTPGAEHISMIGVQIDNSYITSDGMDYRDAAGVALRLAVLACHGILTISQSVIVIDGKYFDLEQPDPAMCKQYSDLADKIDRDLSGQPTVSDGQE